MNQKQREFLLGRVKIIYQNERQAHKYKGPVKPDLSNHLIAAIMSGKAKMKTIDSLREKIHDRLLKSGKKHAFLTGDSHYRYDDYDNGDCILIKALDLFEAPVSYLREMEVYEARHKEWQDRERAMDQIYESIILKIQIGSDAILDKLIEQVDNLGDLNIVNASLTIKPSAPELAEGKKPKRIAK